jgi:hypothetical protein
MATPTTLPATFVAGNVLTAAQMNDLRGAFRVLQVVSTTLTTTFSASVAQSGEVEVTGLSATITPSSTSSKILVFANVNKGTYGNFALKRDTTLIAVGDAAGSRVQSSGGIVGTSGVWGTNQGIHTLDSPATTSAVTYKVFLRQQLLGTATLYCNRSDDDTNAANVARYASAITVMEISA